MSEQSHPTGIKLFNDEIVCAAWYSQMLLDYPDSQIRSPDIQAGLNSLSLVHR